MEKEGNNLFQVNLKGMIALLSEHIYSNPNTFVPVSYTHLTLPTIA